MATETKVPDAVVAAVNISGALSTYTAQDGTWATATQAGASDVRLSFPSPTGSLNAGAGLQAFSVRVRKVGGANSVDFSIELCENGGGPLASQAVTGLSSTAGVTHSFAWNAALLSDVSGAGVEVRLLQTGGLSGKASNRAYLEVDYIAWSADYSTLIVRAGSSALANGSAITATGWKETRDSALVASTAVLTAAGRKATATVSLLSASGTITATGNATVTEAYAGIAALTGLGTLTSDGAKAALAGSAVEGTGAVVSVGDAGHVAAPQVAGISNIAAGGMKGVNGEFLTMAVGAVAAQGAPGAMQPGGLAQIAAQSQILVTGLPGRFDAASVAGIGQSAFAGLSGRSGVAILNGSAGIAILMAVEAAPITPAKGGPKYFPILAPRIHFPHPAPRIQVTPARRTRF